VKEDGTVGPEAVGVGWKVKHVLRVDVGDQPVPTNG
jgi:hypothetical protein